MSESDVYRRQILTSKVDPRTVRVKPYTTKHEYNRFKHVSLAIKSLLLAKKYAFKQQILQMFGRDQISPFSSCRSR